MYRVEDLPISIPIGRQGENHAMKIEIDCSSFLAEWPQATITAMLKRSVAENPYILITSIDSKGVLTWEPTAHDTGIEGDGQIEIRAVENDVLAKSVTAIVCVERSLTPPEPDTPIDWVEDIKSDIAQSVTSAANSATDAAKSAASAQESASAAAGSAAAAQSSANAAAGNASAANKSATSAAGSADAASGSASEAAQSASEADASAKASAASAAEAAGTLDSVKASADAAAASARAAAKSASEAANSKSNAAQSATDAAQAASAAAGSASQSAAARDAAQSAAAAAGAAASDAAESASAASGSKDAAAQSASEAAASAVAAEKAAQDAMEIIDDDVIADDSTWSSKQITDQNYTRFTVSGNPAVCEDVLEGYPLELSASWEPRQEGSGTPSPDNVRPIIKKENVTISRYGTNLINAWNKIPAMVERDGLKIEKTQDGRLHVTGNKSTSSNQGTDIFRVDVDIIALPKGTYSWGEDIVMQSSQGNLHTSPYVCNETITIHALYATVYEQKKYDQYYVPALVVGVTKPTQGADKYVASTKNVVLPKIICGGKIRAANGTGQETWGYIASYAGEALPGEWISDRDEYAEGTTPTTGAQVAYKLATPVPFEVTDGQTMPALAGTNVIIIDADTLTVGAVKPLRKPIDDTRVGTDNVWSVKHTVDTLLPMQTVTGNPVVIEALEGYPLELSASWEPKQEGSGKPSPDNVRPITGTNTIHLQQSKLNMLNPADISDIATEEAYGIKTEHIGDNAFRLKGTWQENGNRSFAIMYTNQNLLSGRGLKIIDTGVSGTYLAHTLYGLRTRQEQAIALLTDNWAPGTAVDMTIKIGVYAPETVPTEYQPYEGRQLLLTLPHTVYGGKIDPATGKGQETWGYIASYAGETLPGEWISDRDEYAAGTAPTTGAQVAYKLATPAPFETTGGQTALALAGTNVIITDADALTATAPAPPQTTASAAEAQAAKLDYIAMMADVDMDDLLAVDDAGADTGMDMDMPTDIEGSKTDGEQEV